MTDLFDPANIIAAMERHGAKIERKPGCVNITYIEGVSADGTLNDDHRDQWNDRRIVIMFDEAGVPTIALNVACTTTPGYYYDVQHVIGGPQGAAMIAHGQQAAWTVGYHHQDPDHPALVQGGGPVTVYRDFDHSFRRQAGHTTTGWYGINQHGTGGRDGDLDTIGFHSAGCLVGRVWQRHLDFMRLVRADPRYLADHAFVFPTTVMPSSWLTEGAVVTPPAPAPGVRTVDEQITTLAKRSELAAVNWRGRGRAPIGYITGMAMAYAKTYAALKVGEWTAMNIAQLPAGTSRSDALRWYAADTSSNVAALRSTFQLLIGLGMRESSGRYCEGRDRSTDNVQADTAEAGLFQQSWDSRGASSELPKLFEVWSNNPGLDGLITAFRDGVTCTPSDLENYGSGDGATFQRLCKTKPLFAVLCAAVGLRTMRTHWGPINRREAELRPEAAALLKAVEGVVDHGGGEIANVRAPVGLLATMQERAAYGMSNLNQDQWLLVFRSLLLIAGTVLVQHGIFSDENWQIISGAALQVFPVVWGLFAHTQKAQLANVAAMPVVRQVKVTDPILAQSIPSPKVTT